jgi:MoxR-like ATPase
LKFLRPRRVVKLPATAELPESDHVFTNDSIAAINAALAAGRPLLVRGEPGTGKSQLARAAAVGLRRVFLSKVIDSRTEARDLQFTFDAVARLADAQVLGALDVPPEEVKHELRQTKYVDPGPLWWAFDWKSARDVASESGAPVPEVPPRWRPGNGAVLLIDEIDKADSALPNGLLEALGNARFPRPGGGYVTCGGEAPLTIVTTNEERSLPDAFLRRCLVLQLDWPHDKETFIAALVAWGLAHFPAVDAAVLRQAAEAVEQDRALIRERGLNPPGGAEYLDLVRAVAEQLPQDPEGQSKLIEKIRRFVLRKHRQEGAE